MKKRISPASGLQIKVAKTQFILAPCAALLLFIAAFVFLPYVESTFRASAAGSQSDVALGITNAYARLYTTGDVTMEITDPSATGSIVSGRANVLVNTNSPTGYKLYLSASDESGSTANMVNPDAYQGVITPLSTSSLQTFSDFNTWGYAALGDDVVDTFSAGGYSGELTGKLFKGVSHLGDTTNPTGSNGLLAQSDHPRSTGMITDVYYAAYVSAGTPAGAYSTDLTYTLVAEYVSSTDDPNNPGKDPNPPAGGNNHTGDYAYTDSNNRPHYVGTSVGEYYHYEDGGDRVVTALGVNKTEDSAIASIANLNDGNITWAAIAVIAGASATFLAIALLRDREDEEDE